MTHPAAPLWKRLLSILYDILILAAVSLAYFAIATAVSTLIGNEASEYRPNTNSIFTQLGWLFTLLGFYCYFWLKIGQTVAMKAWKLKVVADNGEALTLRTCIARCILGFIAFFAGGLGYFWALVDKDNKALHDRLTNTSVIVVDRHQS